MTFAPEFLGQENSPILIVLCQKGKGYRARSVILTAVIRKGTAVLGTRQRVPPEHWCFSVGVTSQYNPKDSDRRWKVFYLRPFSDAWV
jgi:hypothetical protein